MLLRQVAGSVSDDSLRGGGRLYRRFDVTTASAEMHHGKETWQPPVVIGIKISVGIRDMT